MACRHIYNKLKVMKDNISLEGEGYIEINGQKLPDPKKHQLISFIKSGIRIAGYILLPFSLEIAAGVLIFSEIIGIIEELV